MEKAVLEKYADLLVEMGVNPDPGQEVLILADLDQPEFVRMVTEKFYKRGAGRVVVVWNDMATEKLHWLYQSDEMLAEVMPWALARWQWRKDKLPALLWLDSDDPDGMAGVDAAKRARAQMAQFPIIKPFRQATENRHQWCIAGVPGVKWARKVFPGCPDDEAVEKLWKAILHAARATGDPIANWREHNATIHRRCEKLNALNLAGLEYRSARGTDFKVGLIPDGRFCGAAETDLSGRGFNPNIPSEEIFTSPMRGKAEGILYAAKPLSYQGLLIEDFSIRFENGKAVEVKAAKNQEALERMIAMDEGAAYLGECALIDYHSPINETGILFYSTLYDENASCHLALGRGFNDCIRNYEKFSQDELHAKGINDSMIHVDFMVGDDMLDIDGVTPSGEKIAIFRKGSWCF